MRKKIETIKGFTLVELLVTVAIILMMAVISVPSFLALGEQGTFDEKTAELKALAEEAYLLSINKDQGTAMYFLKVDSTAKTASLIKSGTTDPNDSSATIVRQVKFPDQTLVDSVRAFDSGSGTQGKYITFPNVIEHYRLNEAETGQIHSAGNPYCVETATLPASPVCVESPYSSVNGYAGDLFVSIRDVKLGVTKEIRLFKYPSFYVRVQ